jgi:hypothetical protein
LSKNSLAFAYVHECTHILIFAEERKRGRVTENHGPIFFLTNCALSHRIDIKTDDNYFFNKISFYSYQDCPFDESWTVEESKSAVVTFCLKNYKQLATSDLTAEDLTTKAWDLWDIEKSELIEKKKKANDFEQKMEHLKGVNEQLAAANEKLQDEKNKLQQFVENSKGWKFIYLTDWLTVYIICAVIGVAVFSVGVGVGMSNTKHTSEAQKK